MAQNATLSVYARAKIAKPNIIYIYCHWCILSGVIALELDSLREMIRPRVSISNVEFIIINVYIWFKSSIELGNTHDLCKHIVSITEVTCRTNLYIHDSRRQRGIRKRVNHIPHPVLTVRQPKRGARHTPKRTNTTDTKTHT